MNLAKITVLFASGLVLLTYAGAQEILPQGNPYIAIPSRNIFSLSPTAAEDIQSSKTNSAEAPVTITPTGVMTILGPLQVLFKVSDTPRAGRILKEKFFILGEGEHEEDIEVVHIDTKARVVTFNNHGVVQAIALANAPTNLLASLPSAPIVASEVPHSAPGRRPPYLAIDPTTGESLPPAKTKSEEILMIEAQRAYFNSLNTPEGRQMALSLPPTALTPLDAFQPAPVNSQAGSAGTQNPGDDVPK